MRLFARALVYATLASWAGDAHAQDACVVDSPEPRELQLTPAPGSPEPATLDSPIIARFASNVDVAQYAPETLLELRRVQDDGTEAPVEGDYERDEAQANVLVFRPEGGLEAGALYAGIATDPLDSSTRQLGFETSDGDDGEPPRFASSAQVTLRAGSRIDDCQGTRVDVAFRPALDDGPRGSVEHLVYQTRGAALSVPVLRARVRASMGSEVSTSFVLDDAQAEQPLCVLVLPVDGVGRVGEPLGPECFAPDGGARFVGLCASARAGAGVGWAALAWLGLAFWMLCRRLRRHGRA